MHSLRVAYENWSDEARFNHLLELLRAYPCGIDQVALFTTAVHIPLTLPELSRRMQIAAGRMQALRGMGLKAGINS